MTNKERTIAECQVENLINDISNRYGQAVSDSLIKLYGDSPEQLGALELEALRDDLITVENDK